MDARQGGVQAAGKPSDEHADEDNVGELLGWSGGAEAAAPSADGGWAAEGDIEAGAPAPSVAAAAPAPAPTAEATIT